MEAESKVPVVLPVTVVVANKVPIYVHDASTDLKAKRWTLPKAVPTAIEIVESESAFVAIEVPNFSL